MHGWLILDKPVGMGSTQALARVKTILGIRKAGHAGTLDPLASGLLPIALGEATKTVRLTMDAHKEYTFSIDWGSSTTTLDRQGQITARSDQSPAPAQIRQTLANMIGSVDQRPPKYSAIKVNGKRAYHLARAGASVDLTPRRVTLFDAQMTHTSTPQTSCFHIRCGKGFYVRALARDLAERLGVCGHVSALRRTRVGNFSLRNAKTLEMISEMSNKGLSGDCLIPIIHALNGVDIVNVSGKDSSSLRHGQHVAVTAAPEPRHWQDDSLKDPSVRPVLAVHASTPVALGHIRENRFYPTRVFREYIHSRTNPKD